MPAVAAIIQHGDIVDLDLPVDEPNILVQSLSVAPVREKQEYKAGPGYVRGLRFKNPIITFGFDGYIGALSGLADQHPGTTVASLLNFTVSVHGFDPADGIMVYEDPVRDLGDDLAKVKFNVVQYPFVQPAA